MPIQLRPASVARVLFAIIGALALLHLAALVARHGFGRGRLWGLGAMFDLTREFNVPSFFSGLNMLLCALLAGLIAGQRWRERHPSAIGWSALCTVFVLMPFDELFEVHTSIDAPLHLWLQGTGVPGAVSLLPYVAAVAIGAALLYLLVKVPSPTRRRLVTAGVVYLLGAVLIDGQSARVAEAFGVPLGLAEATTQGIEELIEMVGVALLTHALLLHMADDAMAVAVVHDAARPEPAMQRAAARIG